ncbi:MAG: hypothetical protein ACTSYL_05310 [Candidatus Thorarchaeota archaeon]
MSEAKIEVIPRYTRGFEWFYHLSKTQLADRPWKRLGLLSFYDAPYVESEMLYLSPKQVMLAMAKLAKKKENGLVIVVDAMEKGEMGLSTEQGYDQFMEIFDRTFPNSVKYYFGAGNSERTWLHEHEKLKIPLQWIVKKPNIFAEVLSDASPVGEEVSPADAQIENFEGMREVLIEKLGPPSLTEEVMGRIRSTEASEYAGEAVGLMTVFISPTTAVTRGVKYLGKFMSLVKDRRKQEVKQVYQEWQERVEEGYTIDNLKKFFYEEEENQSGLEEHVRQYKTVLLITETRGSLYDLFLPLILQHLVEEVGYLPPHLRPKKKPRPEEEENSGGQDESSQLDDTLHYEDLSGEDYSGLPDVETKEMGTEKEGLRPEIDISEQEYEGKPETILFLDAATHLSKFTRSFNFALGIPDRYPNITVSASFFTDIDPISDTLRRGVIEYMSDRALVFDMHPHLFDDVTANIPITRKAWLLDRLQELERARRGGGVGFLEYYASAKELWKLHLVEKPEKGIIGEIRGWFHRKT